MTFAQYRNYVGQVAEQIYSYRVRSRAYLAAGWLQCAHRLMAQTRGVTFTGKQSPDVVVREGHKAATSYVSAAIPGHLTVTCYNNAADDAGSDAIALEGLEKGIAEQVRDMEEHLQRKLEASAIKAIRKVVFS
jgi:hypothetical protein